MATQTAAAKAKTGPAVAQEHQKAEGGLRRRTWGRETRLENASHAQQPRLRVRRSKPPAVSASVSAHSPSLCFFLPFVKGGAELFASSSFLEGIPRGGAVGPVRDMRFIFLAKTRSSCSRRPMAATRTRLSTTFSTKIRMPWTCCSATVKATRACTAEGPGEDFARQIAADAWYVNSPNLTAAETRRLERVGDAVEVLLDKIG